MKPIKITVKCQEFNKGSAQWSLSLTDNSCTTYMCDTIVRPNAASITAIAELAAIWTALQQIRGYQWVLIRCSNETATVLKWFLYGEPPAGYEAACRHFKYFCDKHDLMNIDLKSNSGLG